MSFRILATKLLLLSGSIALLSCQLLYGLDDYERADEAAVQGSAQGSGVGSGQGGGSSSSTSSGIGGSGGCTCADAALSPWEGPYFVFSAPGDSPFSTCTDGQMPMGQVWETPPDASCSPCACLPGPPCSVPTLNYYSQDSCAGGASSIGGQFADTDCHSMGGGSMMMTGAPQVTGTCAPSGGQLQSASWGAVHTLCNPHTAMDSMCDPGQACFSLLGSTQGRLCIFMGGNTACPQGWPDKISGYLGGGQDNRSCTQCSCGPMQGVGCGGAFKLHYILNCNDFLPFTPQLNSCYNTPAWGELNQPSGGYCGASGGALTGTFNPGVEATVCCALP